MIRKAFAAILVLSILAAFAGCSVKVAPDPNTGLPQNASDTPLIPDSPQQNSNTPPGSNPDENVSNIPFVGGLKLGDTKEKVQEMLGKDYMEKSFDEAEHFPEKFLNWEYKDGYTITIGKDSNKVLQIIATAQGVKTNLDVKIGDKADAALGTYRAKYMEPNSIQGGAKLFGVFKVENGQALILDFNIRDGLVNPGGEIRPDETLERMILTYPAYLDESF